MGYHFKRNESVAEAVRRIAGEELGSVVEQLGRATGAGRDEAIHEARKGVKKTRALMRLVQPELGESYRTESRVLRQAGRKLSEFRDAGSVIEILDKLQSKYAGKLRKSDIDSIRRDLLERKKQAGERDNVAGALREIAAALKSARKGVKTWPISSHGFPALEPGLEATLRKGRAAFKLAKKRPRPENYHDWRKRVKDHWYHIRLLENVWTEWMQGYEASLKDLENWLGDDHNLVLLRERLDGEPARVRERKSFDLILSLIDKYQKEARDNAESFGERIHREKPRAFIKRMRNLWEEWQTEPKSLADFEKTVRKNRRAA